MDDWIFSSWEHPPGVLVAEIAEVRGETHGRNPVPQFTNSVTLGKSLNVRQFMSLLQGDGQQVHKGRPD